MRPLVVRACGTSRTLCELPPWWKSWLEGLLEQWVLHEGDGVMDQDHDESGLMQTLKRTGYLRPRQWTQLLEDLGGHATNYEGSGGNLKLHRH